MGRKRKKKVKIDSEKMIKFAVLIVLFGIMILAVCSPQSLSKIESVYGIKISDYIEYDEEIGSSGLYENKINVETKTSDELVCEKDKLNIFFLDVGQADSSLIVYNDMSMLIDAGNVNDGELILEGIKKLGLKDIDYVIGTHIHEDHLGGLKDVVKGIDVGKIYLPYNDSSTTKYYKELLKVIQSKDMMIEEALVGDKIKFTDKIEVEIMAVDNNQPEDANDASIVVELSYGDMDYLFMGDATTKVEKGRVWNDIDVLKVGHHGSNTSSSKSFLEQVSPEISIISVGKENTYGLPKDTIIKRLNSVGTNIYRTDNVGTIQIISDGKDNELLEIDVSFDGNED